MKKKTASFLTKASLVAFSLIVSLSQTFAQDLSIKGKVIDENTNIPLENIFIRIKGSSKTATTDSSGLFLINGLDKKIYTLVFSCVGCTSIEKTINSGSPDISIKIKTDGNQLQGVEVYGRKKKSALDDPSIHPIAWESSVSRISASNIENIGTTNLAGALKYNVGGNITEQGRKHKEFFSVRGQMTNADFAIDGVSMYYFLDGPSALSSEAIQEIEITRSSNALLYGFSGLNGLVNIKTKTFNKTATYASAEYGTFNTFHASLTHGGKIGDVHYLISAVRDQTDGPLNRNATEKSWNFFGKLTYSFHDWLEMEVQQFYIKSMREFAQTFSSDKFPVALGTQSQIWKYDPLNLSLTQTKIKIRESKIATTELKYYYLQNQENWHNRTYVIAKVNGVQTLTSAIKDVITPEPDYVHGMGLIQSVRLIENNTFRMGGDYYHGVMNTNGIQRKNTIDAMILDEHSFGKLSLNAGMKIIRDYYKYYAPGTAIIKNQWQPAYLNFSLGASFILNQNTILNYIINTGTVPAPDGSLKIINGLPQTVDNENRLAMDLGLVKRLNGMGDITLTAFYSNRKNAFEYSGTLYTDNNGNQAEYLNNKDLRSYGAELAYKSPVVLGILSGFANVMGQYTADVTGGQKVEYQRVPEFITNGGINAQKSGFTLNILGRYVYKYIGDRFIVLKNSSQKIYVGDYLNFDVNLSYNMPLTPISIFGKVSNLFDVRYATISPAYPDYGRRICFGLKASF